MAEKLVFRSEWVNQMNAYAIYGESLLPNEYAILRVAAPLRKTKPEAYIPQFVSMGPYHHSILEKDIESSCEESKISTAETLKGKAVARFSQKGKSFKTIVELMEQIRPEIERFYHWRTGSSTTADQEHPQNITGSTTADQEHSQNFALMMAVDSAFLLHFLASISGYRDSSSSPELGPLQECIKSDILKLENQIPLFVMESASSSFEDFHRVLQEACPQLSPFEFEGNNPKEAVKGRQPHLLAYLHAFVSPTLQIEKETKTPNLCQRFNIDIRDIPLMLAAIFVIPNLVFERKYEMALNAEKLAKAGIKFKLLSHVTEKIRFDSWSGTLYLPQINVCEMQTEVLLRNMVALEFNDVERRGTTVMRYIGLMDSLIQTPDDVRVLRDHRVIATDRVTDESIAKMWNDLAQPFFTGQFNLAPLSDDLVGGLFFVLSEQRLKSKLKRMVGGLYDHVSNWKFFGFVAAILGLFMTAVQTYFTVYPRKN